MDSPLKTIDCARNLKRLLFLLGLLILTSAGSSRLLAQGVDTTFTANVYGGQYLANGAAIRPDGKIVIWGNFNSVGPTTNPPTVLNNIAVLNTNGSPNLGFLPSSGANNTINCVAIQTDGRMVVGGNFTTINGVSQPYLCRMNTDGSLDTSFTPGISGGGVFSVAIQSNGQIIAAGNFTSVNGSSQVRITRLNTDGSLDTTFSQSATASGQINSVFVQPDGNIVIGGAFTSVNGTSVNRISRLTSTGVLDTNFNPGTGANGTVSCLLLQTDGSIVICGTFTSVNGTTRTGIARLAGTGILDTTFNPNTPASGAGPFSSIALQTDGKLIVVGNFTSFDGATHVRMVRLASAGAVDSTFSPVSFNNQVNSVALQNDGSILVAGAFEDVGESNLVARLTNSTATKTLSVTAPTTVTWSRINACPEVWNTTFELSTDQGNTWTSLGSVARMSGGWQLTGLSLPSTGIVRARAQATGGLGNGGQELIEQVVAYGGATLQPVANATGATPTATTQAPGFPVTYGATLNGTVNALGNSTTVTIQYGFNTGYGFVATPAQSPLGGTTLTTVSAALTNLQSATTYHYRVQAVSTAGTTYSSDATFTTLSNVDTLSSLSVPGSAMSPAYSTSNPPSEAYDAVVPANSTSATIDLGTTDPNSTVSINGVALPAGTTSTVVSLVPGNNNFSIVVTASNGITTNTYSLTITTAGMPTATAQPADVADVYAVLRVQAQAMDTSATVTFQYGPDTTYGSTIAGPTISGGLATNCWKTITGLTPGATYHYQATVTNNQGTAVSQDQSFTTYLTPPAGSIDSNFSASATDVQATATQPNGQIIVGGFFTSVNGVSAGDIARLNSNGTLDTSFAANVTQGVVDCVAVQPDGKILIGGTFNTVDGTSMPNLARLNTDGSLDTTFAPNANSQVACIAIQPNGQIIVGGYFTTIDGASQEYLARLNTDGSLDTSFAPSVSLWVNSVALQTNGQMVIGGWFSTVNGTSTGRVARLNTDGSTDTSFAANPNSPPNCVAVQPNGQVIVGGPFTTVGGTAASRLVRLNADGSLDTSFTPNPDGPVYCVSLQTDGHILLGGSFQNVSATPRRFVARLNSDGSLDPIFNPDANASVYSIAAQSNGEVLLGGVFANVFGQSNTGLALALNDPASQTVSVPDLTQIQWTRSGSEPEANTVTFDLSTDGGNTWNSLGAGTRVTGGWQLTGLNLPASGLIRARGYTASGNDSGSSGIIEQDLSYPPTITASTANLAENAITLVITGTGFDPIAANNTVTLSDGAVGTVTAATATSLTVSFTTDPTALGNLTAVVTTDGQSSGAAVQVATVGPPTYTITTTASPAADGATNGGGAFNSGDTVTVTATPNAGYTFVNWTVNGSPVSTSASYSFSATASEALVANFSAGVPAMPPWGRLVLAGSLLLLAWRKLPARRSPSIGHQ